MGYNADSEDDANEDGLLEVVQASAFLELGGEWPFKKWDISKILHSTSIYVLENRPLTE